MSVLVSYPRRARAASVTVLGPCVCVSVCYHVFCHRAQQCAQQDIPAASAGHEQSFNNGVFFNNASFRSYGVICLPRKPPALFPELIPSTAQGYKVVLTGR